MTFTACSTGSWGVQCNETCACLTANTAECNKAIGCLCNTGWDGVDCSQDLDECTLGTDNCTEFSTCTNTEGSFTCACNDGYIDDNGVCAGMLTL